MMRDMSSTAALEIGPAQRWRPLRGGAELASVLRENLLARECCRKKLAAVEVHHQGKPLQMLRFTDIVCCCGVHEQELIARLAHAHTHADVDDDDDDGVSDDEQSADTHVAFADDDDHDEGEVDAHWEHANSVDEEGDTHEAHVNRDDQEGDAHKTRVNFVMQCVDFDDHGEGVGDTHETHVGLLLQCVSSDHDEGQGDTHEAHAGFFDDDDDDDEMEQDTQVAHADYGGDGDEDAHVAIHADYDEDESSDDVDDDEGEADIHEAHVDDDDNDDDDDGGSGNDDIGEDDGAGREANPHAGALYCPQELVRTEVNEPGKSEAHELPLLQSRRQQRSMKQARCSKPYAHHGHGDEDDRPHLPHDLLLDVLLRCLPLPQVISARAVCRAWHQALSSPRCFHILIHNPDSARPYLIAQTSTPFSPSCLTFFDPARGCWPCTPIRLPPFPLFAAAGGLLCFKKNLSSTCRNHVLLVGSPLTQQWRELPPVPVDVGGEHGRSPWCAMCADQLQGCYKVFVVHTTSDKVLNIYTYESTTAQWEGYTHEHREPDNVPNEGISTHRHTFNLSPNGSLLQISCVEGRILSYNTTDHSFHIINIGSYPRCLDTFDLNITSAPYARLPTVACCGEKFYLVGRVSMEASKVGGRLPLTLHRPVGIWELKVNSAGTHGDWVGPVTKTNEDDLECAISGSDGTDFYVISDCQSTIYLFLTGGTTMLVYDVTSKLWSSMPGCPTAHLLSLQGEAYYQPLLWPGPV